MCQQYAVTTQNLALGFCERLMSAFFANFFQLGDEVLSTFRDAENSDIRSWKQLSASPIRSTCHKHSQSHSSA